MRNCFDLLNLNTFILIGRYLMVFFTHDYKKYNTIIMMINRHLIMDKKSCLDESLVQEKRKSKNMSQK